MKHAGFFRAGLLCVALLFAALPPVHAASRADAYAVAFAFFPQADHIGEPSGDPPAAPVYDHGALIGYAYLTNDVVRIPGYSGRPINTLVGLDLQGKITGVTIVEHEEPILVLGISEERLARHIAQYQGKSAFDHFAVGPEREGYVSVDAISGATVTTMVENAIITRSARTVARARGLGPAFSPLPQMPAGTAKTVIHAPSAISKTANAATPSPAAAGEPAPEPIWVGVWRDRTFRIVVLGVGLFILTLILVFQDWLARRPAFLLYVRDGYLLYTLFFIGWYALAQLSVVNVLTFVYAAMRDFHWGTFLIDPMMFILWLFVAVTILLWGRGVYCGWLCPYGALQELVNQLGRRLRVPQLEFPDVVHERLWAVKYVILLLLFGISLQSLSEAERYAEVEPFKTAITLRFQREWGYVFFAAGMVLVSAFNRKFYCKYLCALGAALTIPARFRIFDWLWRRKECGRSCRVCEVECEVQAIRPTGEINANECHYCLDCQVTYYNEHKCPPLVERRKRRERSARARELARGMESTIGPSGLDKIGVKVVSPGGKGGRGGKD